MEWTAVLTERIWRRWGQGRSHATWSLIPFLTELRKRLLWSLLALLIGMAVAWNFSGVMLHAIERPLSRPGYLHTIERHALTIVRAQFPRLAASLPVAAGQAAGEAVDRRLNYTAPLEPFFVQVKLSLLAGVACALPFLLYHGWRLVAPGLRGPTKWVAIPVIIVGTTSFLAGALFFLGVLWPAIINFSLSYESEGLRSWFSLTEYVNFCLRLICVFGLVFELPLAASILARIGLLSAGFLARQRRFAVLASAVIAAFHADLVTMAVVWIPLYCMYELSIWSARLFGGKVPTAATPA